MQLLLDQDFPLPAMTVFDQWRKRKMTLQMATHDVVMSRDYRAPEVLARMLDLHNKGRALLEQVEELRIQRLLRSKQVPFMTHDLIESWLEAQSPENYGEVGRSQVLGLIGDSQTAKTWKAMSLYPEKTLKLSCNALPYGILPSLTDFDREKIRCLVFDEIRPDQILGNRELFQSGQWRVKLGQSNCGQHEYSVWLYFIPIIICANDLILDPNSLHYKADLNWLEENIVLVHLKPGQKWYLGKKVKGKIVPLDAAV